MRVLVGGGFVRIAEGVTPDAVFAADAVEDVLSGEGVKSAIDGDGVGVRGKFFEDFDGTEGAGGFCQNFQDAGPDGCASQFTAFQNARDGVLFWH